MSSGASPDEWLTTKLADGTIGESSPMWPVLLEATGSPAASLRRRLRARRLRPQPWWPLASAMEMLVFADHTDLAAQLCERTVAAYGLRSGTTLDEETHPFRTVLLAPALPAPRLPDPALTADDPTLQRLARTGEYLDPASVLGQGLTFLYQHGHEHPLAYLLGGNHWAQPPGELTWGQQWAERLDELSEDESSRLWAAVYAARHEDLAHRLHQRHGLSSPLWYVNAWYAGVQVRDGDPVAARRTLTEALHHWLPFKAWNVLPVDLAVQDTLRPAATPSFRSQILATLPAHLPWEKNS
ncbi:hypothetical protein [Kineococcus arenarius]|uniref:hypothetical protein n=1 Tax=unclassified Kineococcus TaxID=2621656 RepID=UPI003D7E2EC8